MKKIHAVQSSIGETLGIDHASKRKNDLRRWLVAGLLVLVIIILFLIINKTGQPDPVKYKTEIVKHSDLVVMVTATGTLQPTNEVTVSSELSGIIKHVHVDYNDTVMAGQVLATLDTSKLEAQVTQYQAALESAMAKVLQSQATVAETSAKLVQYKKVRELSSNKVPSQSDLDSAEASYKRAKADEAGSKAAVLQAKANLSAIETDFSKSVIRSPINGIVLSRTIEAGQTVAVSLSAPTLFTLAEDLKLMELLVNVDEADVGKVKAGQKATFTVAAHPNRTFYARIREVRYASSTASGVVTYCTVLKVNNADMALRPGMTATADIVVKNIRNALLIPNAALRFNPPAIEQNVSSPPSGGSGLVSSLLPRPPIGKARPKSALNADNMKQNVWILKNNDPLSVPVTIGSTNGIMTEVLSGNIKEGMWVITDTIVSGI